MIKLNKKLQIIIIFFTGFLYLGTSAAAENLYIFYPSVVSAALVQKKLTKACPKISIMVFGRFKDFKNHVKKNVPDAILTKKPVIDRVGGYTVKIQGVRQGDTQESSVFLSVNKTIDISALSGKSIGVFDILGRKGMKGFIGKFLNPVPKLKRVSKMEDLLPMLTFNMVEGILIPEIYVDYYKKISKLNFIISPFPAMKTEILALGAAQGKDASVIIKSLTALDKQYMALLEVEQWK